jgi:uncharacterized protein YkwD
LRSFWNGLSKSGSLPPGTKLALAAFVLVFPIALLSPQAASHGAVEGGAAGELSQLEIEMWHMVNRDRMSRAVVRETKGRAVPLEWDSRLAAVARAHSREMATTGVFSHEALDGSLPVTRLTNAGVRLRSAGENIAKAYDPSQAEALFMNEPKFSPNHRGNILNPAYNRIGIGIARASDGSLYITQDFAQVP